MSDIIPPPPPMRKRTTQKSDTPTHLDDTTYVEGAWENDDEVEDFFSTPSPSAHTVNDTSGVGFDVYTDYDGDGVEDGEGDFFSSTTSTSVEDDVIDVTLTPLTEPTPTPRSEPVKVTSEPVNPLDEFPDDIIQSVDSLLTYITDDSCTEVLLNGPNECSRKVHGTRYHSPDVRFGDADTYHAVLNRFILPYCDTAARIDGKNVVVEGQLELSIPPGRPPMYARVHIVAPPGVKHAKVTIAKKPRTSITLDKMVKNGTLPQNAADFLKAIARGHKTMVVSGPTGAGKTTLLQALTYYFDPSDRVVVVEETPELQLPLGDVVYLKSTLELPGQDPSEVYSLGFWVKQANRMRMDRVIVGETRGAEFAEWLIAANSGAEGSATTVHADNPRRTLDKMLSLAAKGSTTISESQLRREIAATVDIVVQLGLVNNRHVVTAVEEISNTIAQQTGQIQTNTIFGFDKETNTHVVKGRPSDGLIASLAAQGVPVNQQWFRKGN